MRIGTQVVHARIDVQINQPVGMFLIGFFEVFDRAIFFAQTGVDSGKEVRRNIFLI